MRISLPIAIVFALAWPIYLPAEETVYRNPTLGIAVTKPDTWHFATAAEVAENLERVQLSDKELDALLKAHATAPIVAMTKYKEPFDDLNPSVKVNIKPLRGFPAAEPVRILQVVSEPLRKAFSDLKFITKPEETELAGHKAAYMCVDYDLKIPDGRTFPTRSELWIVPRGKMFFMIGIGTRQDERTGSREEVHKIIESIEIDPERGS